MAFTVRALTDTMANPNTVARIFKQIQRIGFSGLMRNLSKCVGKDWSTKEN